MGKIVSFVSSLFTAGRSCRKREVLLLCFLVLFSLAEGFAGGNQDKGDAWILSEITGDVRINGGRAKQGKTLSPGDLIQVPPEGRTVIIPGARDALLLEESTDLIILPQYAGVSLERGLLLAVLGGWHTRRMAANTDFRINAGSVEVRARATAFVVQRGAGVYACAGFGEVEVLAEGIVKRLRSTHHQAIRIVPGGRDGKPTAQRATTIFHDDAALDALAETAGIGSIDWKD